MKAIIKNILVPTDFSEVADNALSTAIEMCKRQKAALHLLHVVENRFVIGPPEAGMVELDILRENEASGWQNLSGLQRELKEQGFDNVKIHLAFGNPADAIRDKAIELNADIIVMGTHGASGMREFFIGSNAYSVIKNTTTPVLTIPGKTKTTDFKKILFPIRATKGIISKYDFVEPIIEKNNAKLFIVGLSLPGEVYKLGPLNEEIRELGKSLRINKTQFKSEYFVCKNYAKKVLELSKKEKVDLIVINASLDYKWHQFFIGPYTQQVINHSKVPVLSIRNMNAVSAFADTVKEEMANVAQMKMAL